MTPTWLSEPGLQQFFAVTKAAGGEARVVGGAVRDWLMRTGNSSDLDLASTLLPEQTMSLAAQHGWKTIPTGMAHGTVTVLLPERAVEVTTLRRDVETDGRHAKVAYTDNWQEDAARRDFTINAMYMDANGALYDYYGGAGDLQTCTVRFIGDATTRITEDGLRILRFFRFLAHYGQPPADAQALAAIRMLKDRIALLSGERIAAEMKKMLHVQDRLFALQQMYDCGLFPYIFGDEGRVTLYPKMLHHAVQHGITPGAWLGVMALVSPARRYTVAAWVSDRWKLSRVEQEMLAFFAAPLAAVTPAVVKELLRHHDREKVRQRLVIAAMDSDVSEEIFTLARTWEIPQFPLTATDLLALGFTQGKALGDALRALESAWVQSDYTLTRQVLLERARP